MNDALLQGSLVRLAAPNPETEAETIAGWSRDPEFQRLLVTGAPRLWTASGVKADFAEGLSDDRPSEQRFEFVIRTLADGQLIGFTDLEVNDWSQRNAWVSIGIGPRDFWGHGYGSDAMQVLLRFAFTELNLERVTLNVFAYNERAQRSYLKVGFQPEGRQRQRLRRGGQHYDMIFMGILRDEWHSREWRSREAQPSDGQAPLPMGDDNRLADLFRGQLVRLAAQDAERDAETLARWSYDSEFLRLVDTDAARPRTAKFYEADTARRAERANGFNYNIRTLDGDRLIGFISIWVMNWASAEGRVGIGIGERADWGQGYGTDAMRVLLHYAFDELNLARVSLEAFADNPRAIRSYQKAGFTLEGVQRQWLHRDGHRGDVVVMSILREEYAAGRAP